MLLSVNKKVKRYQNRGKQKENYSLIFTFLHILNNDHIQSKKLID